jgi:hypothetical protein
MKTAEGGPTRDEVDLGFETAADADTSRVMNFAAKMGMRAEVEVGEPLGAGSSSALTRNLGARPRVP